MGDQRQKPEKGKPRLGLSKIPSLFLALLIGLAASNHDAAAASKKSWHPLEIDVWDPPFNKELKRKSGTYKALEKASRKWRICVSIPHLKDPYWAAVNYGLIDQAKQLGVSLRLVEAGGYGHLDVQRKQIEDCMASGADGLIVSGISAVGLNDLVARYYDGGKVVIDMINGLATDKVTARAGVDFWDTGFVAASYIVNLQKKTSKPARVAWFPGPEGAAWVGQGDKGFRAGIKGSNVELVATHFGDTGRAAQRKLIKEVLANNTKLDFIVGTTVSAVEAVDQLRKSGRNKEVKVLSYYYGPGVHKGIKRGSVVAAPTDLQALQARMSVDLAVRALEGKPYPKHIAPKVIMVDKSNFRSFDESTSLPPRGFRPIFSINDW